jgi:hypothetical protein
MSFMELIPDCYDSTEQLCCDYKPSLLEMSVFIYRIHCRQDTRHQYSYMYFHHYLQIS